MKTFLKYFTVILFSFFILNNAKALTLEEATKSVVEQSHELKELRLQAESANWGEKKAISNFLPKVDLMGRHLTDEKFEELEIGFAGQNFVMPAIQPYTSLGVTASLNVFNGFQDINDVRAARMQNESFNERILRAEDQKRAEIRTLFYRALGSQILVDVADQNIETLDGHLHDVSSRIRSGVSTRYDSLRVEVQLEDARTEKVAAESNVVISRAKLFEAIGRTDDETALLGKLPENFITFDINQNKIENIKRHDRAALVNDAEQSMAQSWSAKAHWLPQVSLFGNYEWYNNINHSISESDERFKSAYALGVQLNWNLFDGGANYASQKQAAIANQIAQEKLAKFDQNLPISIEETQRRFSYDVINYKSKLSYIRKAEEAVRLARSGVRAGIRTNTEALDALIDLNRAKAAAIKSQIDAIEALGQLELAVGHTL